MKKRKKKILPLLVLSVSVIGTILGGTYAYYASVSDVQNQMITKGSEVFLRELFNKDDYWVPGETKEKAVSFGNQSDLDQVIRFKVTEKWYDNKGTPANLSDDTVWTPVGTYSPPPVVINWTSEVTGGTWVKIGDWYYYTKVFASGSKSSPTLTPDVISSVTFSPSISNAGPGAVDDFSDKRYSLLVEMETLDVNTDMTKEAWHMTFLESGSNLTWSVSP